MFRLILAAAALVPVAFSQSLPAFQWIQEVDASGTDAFAGLGLDAVGNTYIAGSTMSLTFPVKNAVQNHSASAGLYRVDGPGSAYTALGIASAYFVAVDPQNPATIFVLSNGSLLASHDGGVTFSTVSLPPGSQPASLAINPADDQVLYVGTYNQGLLKSVDGGATWTAASGALTGNYQEIWIDPASPNTIFANSQANFLRSADSGASWQTVLSDTDILSVSFDSANPAVVYAATNLGADFKSTDTGHTFTALTTPAPLGTILPDPNHPGRLAAIAENGIYESDDGGSTWTSKLSVTNLNYELFVADWPNGHLYAASGLTALRITSDLTTSTPVGPPAYGLIGGLAVGGGHLYVAVRGSHDVFVTKLDPSGNIIYSTYFGGSADDTATAMAVDSSGNVYVTGTTSSADFPTAEGAYAVKGASFVFKLNPDGSLGYSTRFAPGGTIPLAIAVDAAGSAYLAGTTGGNLPVTPGAYQTTCSYCGVFSTGFVVRASSSDAHTGPARPDLALVVNSGFLTKFDPAGATLIYSTYIGGTVQFEDGVVSTLALSLDGSAYVGGLNGIFHLNAAGSALLGSLPAVINPQAIGVAPDGSVFIAGSPGINPPFQTTAGTFEPAIALPPNLPGQGGGATTAIGKWDSQLANQLAGTYFGASSAGIKALAFDASGDVYFGGSTAPYGLPTRTPIQAGFASTTGFVSELSGDLSTLLFSSYFGDTDIFRVGGLAVRRDGSLALGGATGMVNNASAVANIWVNSVALAPPPALRIDAVENAASVLDGPISSGETIFVKGAGFDSGAQLSIGGVTATPISVTSSVITATVPEGIPSVAAMVQAQSGGSASNQVLVPVSAASPGIFSQDGSGFGQGYILNKDGTLNTPSNPAAPGDPITIYATGAGPISFTDGYAVTQFPVNVGIDGWYCDGIAAVLGPVAGLPGMVYQISVYVPTLARIRGGNPNLTNFQFPNPSPVTMQIDGVASQRGLAISLSQ